MSKPGVWVKSRGGNFALRDGRGHDAPVRDVGPVVAEWFSHLHRSQIEGDKDLLVLDQDPPNAAYLKDQKDREHLRKLVKGGISAEAEERVLVDEAIAQKLDAQAKVPEETRKRVAHGKEAATELAKHHGG